MVFFCGMVILVVFNVFLVVKDLEILTQIVPDVSIYPYLYYTLHLLLSLDQFMQDKWLLFCQR